MKICVAQTRAAKGNVPANLANHKKWIDVAISHRAAMIFFPELSVTGYEPELARGLATDHDDRRLDDLHHISNTHEIAIAVGAPIKSDTGIMIGMIVFQPGKPRQTYCKQQLHADELPYFVSGGGQLIFTIGGRKIAPSICFESLQASHAKKAYQLGAGIYVAIVAKSQEGVEKALRHYPGIAKKYSMPVLMANCVGYCDNFEGAGQSSVWTKSGKLIGQLDDKSEGLLIFDAETEEIVEKTL